MQMAAEEKRLGEQRRALTLFFLKNKHCSAVLFMEIGTMQTFGLKSQLTNNINRPVADHRLAN